MNGLVCSRKGGHGVEGDGEGNNNQSKAEGKRRDLSVFYLKDQIRMMMLSCWEKDSKCSMCVLLRVMVCWENINIR